MSKIDKKFSKEGLDRRKPYDKSRQYKKHTGNKSEGQGFADLRKQKVKRGYYKFIKKQEKKAQQAKEEVKDGNSSEPDTNDEEQSSKEISQNSFKEKQNRFSKAKEEFEKQKAEELRQKEEAIKEKEARDEAIRIYNEKKAEKHNKFKIRTSKGQPIMKYRMQDLLQQIQTMKSKNKL
ncbi:hypothetical protein LOTGIDRAFT_235139 [Lottia gigantea]|uniref:rRNA-processing protein FYV7 n=1 Tax=Lottia gigantea TaxID=225164 RepID=V4BDT6_LOTGI|nr:hypothetical protein LOTGIDRAFT_235139 [Lottia gigantea]ESO86944.1 hypothetical protein LOTGIDRAFT_235139 [Lottia gigantea]